jgi:SAM-dependent methyltransferase
VSPDRFALVACPRCGNTLTGNDVLCCTRCGKVGTMLSEHLLDFASDDTDTLRAIGSWPGEFVRSLPAWAEALATAPASASSADAHAHGLVGADGSLTPLGQTIRYHLDEQRWQKGRRGLDGVLELADLGATVRVLDVGCGAGQTLRLLDPDRPVELFGVDMDGAAVALGARLAEVEGTDLTLVRGSALALPFRTEVFDLVLTRVALNYMHQRSALAEMTRLLRPGGLLFCRVERIWHDLSLLRAARGAKPLVCRLRDLGWGTVHALTGWQPTPGSKTGGGRAFASARRLRQILARLGCQVTHAAESPNGPLLAGRRTQLIVVARKEPG